MPRWRTLVRRTVLLSVVALLLAGGVVAAVFGTGHHGTDRSVETVRDDPNVTIDRASDGFGAGRGYVLQPRSGAGSADATVGLVFYPGARVHSDAYLTALAPLASEAGVTVVVPKLRLNLAVIEVGAATSVIESRPAVDRWYVGGHSLGGAMACRYARDHADRVEGIVLLGSYCDRSVRGRGLDALVVTGSADTVLDRSAFRANRDNLPADATVVELQGVNHSQFGSYRGQPGDRPSPLSYHEAHRRLRGVLVTWFENRTGRASG